MRFTSNDLYQRLLSRRAPVEDRAFYKFSEAFEAQPGSATRYLLGAMRPVDQKYTARLREQGNRVERQLTDRLKGQHGGLEFRRQGSVSNNTHIKYYSDVDVLTILGLFETLERPQVPAFPYRGEPVDDLLALRKDCVRELRAAFPAVSVDDSGSTAVSLTGGSLACKVDVVPSNWFNTISYVALRQDHQRGIQVLNRETQERVRNYPFLYNHRIDRHDAEQSGIPRMLMRLLKTIRCDAIDDGESVGCSSFDLCSLVYRMPSRYFSVQRNRPLEMIGNLISWLRQTLDEDQLRATLNAVDDSRLIYRDGTTISGVRLVCDELAAKHREAQTELRGLLLLSEAHIG